ncbi:hypothetical protein J2X50_004486 [Aminobacter sp. BE322]
MFAAALLARAASPELRGMQGLLAGRYVQKNRRVRSRESDKNTAWQLGANPLRLTAPVLFPEFAFQFALRPAGRMPCCAGLRLPVFERLSMAES